MKPSVSYAVLAVAAFLAPPLAGAVTYSDMDDAAVFKVQANGFTPTLFWQRPPHPGGDSFAWNWLFHDAVLECPYASLYLDQPCLDAPIPDDVGTLAPGAGFAVGGFPQGSIVTGRWDLATIQATPVPDFLPWHFVNGFRLPGPSDYSGQLVDAGATFQPCPDDSDVDAPPLQGYSSHEFTGASTTTCSPQGDAAARDRFLNHAYNLASLTPNSQPDHDHDGHHDTAEPTTGHPLFASSTPFTDDDGDGTMNGFEPCDETFLVACCTGNYGVVPGPACNGYQTPSGCPTTNADRVCVRQSTVPKQVWAWDPVCRHAWTGAYANCKGSASNYGGSSAAYSGASYLEDGYGWRHIGDLPVLGPFTFDLIEPCPIDGATDSDQDSVPAFRFCWRRYTLTSDGTITSVPGQPAAGPAGDPDDGNDQVPIPGDLVMDPDGDGSASVVELGAGSHFASAESDPLSDDDGDGQFNQNEPLPLVGIEAQRAICTGAYGFVAYPACQGYPNPADTTTVTGYEVVRVGPGPAFYLWDAVCQSSYPVCRATSERGDQVPLYSGTFTTDGYGWRNLGQPLGPQDVTVLGPCSVPVEDQDADNVPLIRVCQRTLTIRPDGSYEFGTESFVSGHGDPDDEDPDDPLPMATLGPAVNELKQAALDAAAFVLAKANEALVLVSGYVEEVNQTKEEILADVLGAIPSVDQVVASLAQTTQDFTDAATREATGLQAAIDCIEAARANYAQQVGQRANEYLADPTPQRLEGLRSTLVVGLSAALDEAAACDAPGTAARVVLGIFQALGDSVTAYVGALDQTLGQAQDVVAAVQEFIGPTAGVLTSTVDLAFSFVDYAVAHAQAYQTELFETFSSLLETIAGLDYGQLAGGLAQEQQSQAAKATVRFTVQDVAQKPVAGASVHVTRGNQTVAQGVTSSQGVYVVSLDAETPFQYSVSKDGFQSRSAGFVTGAAGETVRLTVILDPPVDAASRYAPWVFYSLLGGAVLLLVSRWRRHR